MNRAVLPIGRRRSIRSVPNRSSACALISKPTATRDIDTSPASIRSVGVRRYRDPRRAESMWEGIWARSDAAPTSGSRAGAPRHDHAALTGPHRRSAPGSESDTRSTRRREAIVYV